MNKFSILMSIYYKENPSYFNQCMESIWDNQSLKANEIILVLDGKLTEELYSIINFWEDKLQGILKVIPLKENLGLGDALNIGLSQAKNELVARMDTDDIASPNRFEIQINQMIINNYDMCGSWVSEFEKNEKSITSYRKVPEKHDFILKYAKKRNPFNHPSIMYKKSVVEKSGGYIKMLWFEDYYLWVRVLMSGYTTYNIQKPLVHMRAGYSQLERRRGITYAIEELKFLYKLKSIGFISFVQFIQNALTRFIIRLLPKNLLKNIYKILRGRK